MGTLTLGYYLGLRLAVLPSVALSLGVRL